LTTRIPLAATTIAAIVEMFTVSAPSPPVPTTSTASRSVSTRNACESMESARPSSSAGVGPFIFSATPKAAIWAAVALSDMISSITQPVSALDRSACVVNAPRIRRHVRGCSSLVPAVMVDVPCPSAVDALGAVEA
jgi:hypothetical protein